MNHQISSSFFTANRNRLSELLQSASLAVVNSNHILPTNSDGTFKFKQNNDLFYLTGITQENTTLLLFPGHHDPAMREVLFIEEPQELKIKWDGHRLSASEASSISGIATVNYNHEFNTVLKQLLFYAENIYINAIEHPRATVHIETKDQQFARWCKTTYPLHQYKRLAPLLMNLRMIKSGTEIGLLRTSAEITEKGFRRLLKFIKPGVHEKQVEAEMIHEYLFNGGDWAGYGPIVASGKDSCTLHYISNHKTCKSGDIVLIDAAASYCGYNSDLTRVVPVSGKFTDRQRQVYNSVLKIHKAMCALLKAGALIKDLQQHCNDLFIEELIALNLCSLQEVKTKGAAFYLDRYCFHGFSHFIGLDVHDVGDFNVPLQNGMILTNEPGIYIAEEAIGVRLENNILITATGNEDLMQNIPIEAAEIEELMN